MSQNGSLTRNQVRAIAALLSNRTVEEAAESAGVAARTVYRWLKTNDFKLALTHAKGEVLTDAVRVLITDMQANHRTMIDIRDNEKNDASLRLRAAIALDNSLLKWRELGNVEERLAALEEMVFHETYR